MDAETKKRRLKIAAALLGVVLAIVCRLLPAAYRGPCETIINICTGQ